MEVKQIRAHPRRSDYGAYGGRGIQMCERWRTSFAAFIADMGRRPSPRHSIDRINNDGHYEPGNVRWATRAQQCANRRNTALVWVNGTAVPRIELARAFEVNDSTLRYRLRAGWPLDKALTPTRKEPDATQTPPPDA